MITRLVKMQFLPAEVGAFKSFFEERKTLIRNFEGCQHLELWQDAADETIFFTYSIWDSEAHLNNYRSSDFFSDTWLQTKMKFAAKPEAWTVNILHSL